MTKKAPQPGARSAHSLIIDGVAVPTEYKDLALGKLVLDPDNPRIQHAVKRKFKSGRSARPHGPDLRTARCAGVAYPHTR